MRSIALEMRLAGTVRNLSDGSVEIQCSCSKTALDSFAERVEQLNGVIKVTELMVTELLEQDFTGFKILR